MPDAKEFRFIAPGYVCPTWIRFRFGVLQSNALINVWCVCLQICVMSSSGQPKAFVPKDPLANDIAQNPLFRKCFPHSSAKTPERRRPLGICRRRRTTSTCIQRRISGIYLCQRVPGIYFRQRAPDILLCRIGPHICSIHPYQIIRVSACALSELRPIETSGLNRGIGTHYSWLPPRFKRVLWKTLKTYDPIGRARRAFEITTSVLCFTVVEDMECTYVGQS